MNFVETIKQHPAVFYIASMSTVAVAVAGVMLGYFENFVVQGLENDLKREEDKVQELTNKVNDLEPFIEKYKLYESKVSELEKSNKQLVNKVENSKVNDNCTELKAELSDIKIKNSNLEATISAQEKEITSTKSELSETVKQNNLCLKLIEESKKELALKQNNINDLESTLKEQKIVSPSVNTYDSKSSGDHEEVNEEGFSFKARKCVRKSAGAECTISLTNTGDENRVICIHHGLNSHFIDNLGNKYDVSVTIGGASGGGYGCTKATFLPDVATNIVVTSKKRSNEAKSITIALSSSDFNSKVIAIKNVDINN